VQVKLLRVLQDGSFQRVGGTELRHSNFRLISASNRNFEAMIAEGAFRLDLFYRIGAVTIRLPSLGERLEDIPLLADLALKQFAERHGLRPKRLSDEALEFLQNQRWPGNVRQLMHTVERASIFSESEFILPADFGITETEPIATWRQPPQLGERHGTLPGQEIMGISEPMRVSSAVEEVEKRLIREGLVRNHGNKKRVAAELGISRSYLYKRLAQMGLGTDADVYSAE
jgi:DNA-binding NtrC family response regulator